MSVLQLESTLMKLNRFQSVTLPALAIALAGIFMPSVLQAQGLASLLGCTERGRMPIQRCITQLLEYHCLTLAWDHWDTQDRCRDASRKVVTALDLENLGNDPKNPALPVLKEVAFSTTIAPYFASEDLHELLSELKTDFEDSYRFNIPHSLWETAQTRKITFEKTLRLLATVFQDVSLVQGGSRNLSESTAFHILKMEKLAQNLILAEKRYPHLCKGCSDQAERITLNDELYLELVRRWSKLKIHTGLNPDYVFYPAIKRAPELDPTLHHFYVPAYTAATLKKRGVSDEMAFFASFLFNTLYELRKIEVKLGQDRWPYRFPEPFSDPGSISRVKMNLKKIHTGYVGALFGVHQENRAISLEAFSIEFSRNPRSFIQKLMALRF